MMMMLGVVCGSPEKLGLPTLVFKYFGIYDFLASYSPWTLGESLVGRFGALSRIIPDDVGSTELDRFKMHFTGIVGFPGTDQHCPAMHGYVSYPF